MQTMESTPLQHAEEVAAARGRKFVDTDVYEDVTLAQGALAYLDGYQSAVREEQRERFSYLDDMVAHRAKGKDLSVGMIRGILNCLRADVITRQPKDNEGMAILNSIPTGRYAVRTEEGHWSFWSAWHGDQKGITYLDQLVAGGDGLVKERITLQVAAAIARKIVAMGVNESRTEFGLQVGWCGYHDGPLTNPISRALGYGEECARHNGLPWNETAARATGRYERA